MLPLSAKKPRSWTNEYVRHGTQVLLAALEIASGQVVAHVKQRRTSGNFLRFLKDVVEAFPERELHMVLDNLNIHKNAAAQRWLKRHPRVHFHYTPTHASWVNMVEYFFSILGKQGLSHSVHSSKRQLKEFLLSYIAHNNENPRPFVWTKGPEKLQRIIEATKEYQAAHPKKPRKRRRRPNTRNGPWVLVRLQRSTAVFEWKETNLPPYSGCQFTCACQGWSGLNYRSRPKVALTRTDFRKLNTRL